LSLAQAAFLVSNAKRVVAPDRKCRASQGASVTMIKLTINGKVSDTDADPDTPLLWVLREWIGLTGTKYGCGIAQCGACTVHLDGVVARSCAMAAGQVGNAKITTIEGL